MPANSNPILRTGSVLNVRDGAGLTPAQTVKLGRTIYDNAEKMRCRFLTDAPSIVTKLKPISTPYEETSSCRLRFSPTLTMDFAPCRFYWEERAILETRSVVTICPGDTRGKIWLRLSFINAADCNMSTSQIRECLFEAGEPLKSIWLRYYNETCIDTLGKQFDSNYSLNIFMLSSDGVKGNIRNMLSDYSIAAASGKLTQSIALKILKKEFRDVAGLEIDHSSTPIVDQKVVAYSFPKHQIIEVPQYKSPIEVVSDQDLKALCAINITNLATNVFGVSIEVENPPNYKRSASHLASAEISYELGHIF